MMNVVVLIGRLTADPELRYSVNGTAVTNFRLAVDRSFTSKDGTRETDFINIVCFQRLAETVANHLNKGRLVAVNGRLQVRNWETQEKERRTSTEVVANEVRFLDWPDDGKRSPRKESSAPDSFDDLFDEDISNDVPF